MDPQQEIFTRLLVDLKALGHDVYDGALPPEDTAYPFIYLADSQLTDEENKTAVFGRVNQRIHVWHSDSKQRGTVSQMLLDIKTVCRKIRTTKNFAWSVLGINQQILSDSTTKQPLLHGVIDVEFHFS